MFVLGFGIGSHFYKSRYGTNIKRDWFFGLYPICKSIKFARGWSVESNLSEILEQKRCFVI